MKNRKRVKKIAFVGANPPIGRLANPGGQVTASIGIIEALSANGFEVKVFDTTQASFPIPPMNKRLLKGMGRLFGFTRFVLFNKVEGVLIFVGSGFSFYERIAISFVAKLFHIKSFFFMRDGHFQSEVMASEKKRNYVKRLINFPDFICVQGEAWKHFFEGLGVKQNKILIVRNWLSNEFINLAATPSLLSNKVTFCFIGWLVKEKGIVELLQSAKELDNMGLDFELKLVGSGSLEGFARNFIKQHKLKDKIDILGWKSKSEVKKIYMESDVFVLPSYAEGFPNSLLEAMSLGLPAISTNVGGVPDTLKNDRNGFLIPSKNQSALSDAMKKYIMEPDKIRIHAAEAERIVDELHNKADNVQIILNKLKGTI